MNVYIFGFNRSYAGSMVGLMDIFSRARQLFFAQSGKSGLEEINIKLASVDGKPIPCQNGIQLNVHCSVDDIRRADVFIVTSIHDFDTALSKNRFMVDWLKDRYAQGTALASICTGAFLLAETGLLDGKDATTHWSAADAFRLRYPGIRLKTGRPIVNHGRLFCAEGAGRSTGLACCLLEKYLGPMVARETAKYFLQDFHQAVAPTDYDNQTAYKDIEILQIREWIEKHLNDPVTIENLAREACMSCRTLERRFKKATGQSPLTYIQRMKVEAAKLKLATTNLSISEICYQLGYENSGSFRKIFARWVTLLPSEYRKRCRASCLRPDSYQIYRRPE
jgi:transcriptional regulator GlxA family with amidase domain